MNDAVYHFRRNAGPTLCTPTLGEFAAIPLLLRGDAAHMKARRENTDEWVPLATLIDFTKPWRTRLPDGQNPPPLPASVDSAQGDAGTALARPDRHEAKRVLTPRWGELYAWRDAADPAVTHGASIDRLIQDPPFPPERIQAMEVRHHDAGVWIPLEALRQADGQWPAPPGMARPGGLPFTAGRADALGCYLWTALMVSLPGTFAALVILGGLAEPPPGSRFMAMIKVYELFGFFRIFRGAASLKKGGGLAMARNDGQTSPESNAWNP